MQAIFFRIGGALSKSFAAFGRVVRNPNGGTMPLIPLHQTVRGLFPGLIPPGPKTYAAWPVWRDSTTKEVKFQPLPKKQAVKLWHDARRFERQTRQPGKQDGAISRNGLAVLQALLFDFLNYASGALYPSWAAIAEKACICERSVGRGLDKLKAAGVLNWLRRSEEACRNGGFILRQISNAYAVLPCSQWRGYSPPPPAPPPAPGTWVDHPPIPCMITQAAAAGRAGASLKERVALLRSDPTDSLALALAGLGDAMHGAKP
jgi:hypothetical protein